MGGIYYIDHAEDMAQNGVRNLLVNAFAVNNLINNDHHLKRRIIFEQIPGGHRFLIPLIEAMRDKKCVRISYRSFRSPETREIMLTPFCVKVFNRRWYLLAKNELNREPHFYALERIEEMVTTDDTYCLPVDFDAEAYFANRYGISAAPEDKQECVRLRVKARQVPYLRTLPIHSSQREVETADDASIFELFIIPNYELKQELYKYMSGIEVLSPKWLREEMAKELSKTVKMYKQ